MKKPKANKTIPQPEVATQAPETRAADLFQKLEQERGKDTISLGKSVKGYSALAAIDIRNQSRLSCAPSEEFASFLTEAGTSIAAKCASHGKVIDAWCETTV